MFELQSEFAFRVLMPAVHVLHMPLISIINKKKQENLKVRELMICDSQEELEVKQKEIGKDNLIIF